MKYYKTLTKSGTGPYSGVTWNLPTDDRPGKWMPKIDGELVLCERGYHVCRREDLCSWLDANIYEAEVRGDILFSDDTIVCKEARLLRHIDTWNDRTARLFACDCAEHVLPLFEKKYPQDERPRRAIETARNYADGNASEEKLAAARDAAWAVAGAAAWAAAGDAAGAVAGAAAWAAAGAVARAAAGAVARDAAWAAERKWQTERLFWYLNGEEVDE